jgi:hypothetical protein
MKPLIFTHIHKTGGTTIHHAVANAVGHDAVLIAKTDMEITNLAELVSKRGPLRYIGGHVSRAAARAVFAEAPLVVSLREPIERILSLYFFALRRGTMPQEGRADPRGSGFMFYYRSMFASRDNENYQCRFLCGEPDHLKAIETLKRDYQLAWLSIKSNTAWRFICNALSIPFMELSQDQLEFVAPIARAAADFEQGYRPLSYPDFLAPETYDDLRARNGEDIKLIDWLESRHDGLFALV